MLEQRKILSNALRRPSFDTLMAAGSLKSLSSGVFSQTDGLSALAAYTLGALCRCSHALLKSATFLKRLNMTHCLFPRSGHGLWMSFGDILSIWIGITEIFVRTRALRFFSSRGEKMNAHCMMGDHTTLSLDSLFDNVSGGNGNPWLIWIFSDLTLT